MSVAAHKGRDQFSGLDAPMADAHVLAQISTKFDLLRKTGEWKLMLAVMENGLQGVKEYCRLQSVWRQVPILIKDRIMDAVAWLWDDDTTYIYSFVSICDRIDIDAGSIRKLFLEMMDRPLADVMHEVEVVRATLADLRRHNRGLGYRSVPKDVVAAVERKQQRLRRTVRA